MGSAESVGIEAARAAADLAGTRAFFALTAKLATALAVIRTLLSDARTHHAAFAATLEVARNPSESNQAACA